MKVTYIEHSGFVVEFENCTLVFDYFKGEIPNLRDDKPIYVFSSHNHHDHFNFEIFQLFNNYSNIHYILSNDIKRKFNKSFFLSKGVCEKIYNSIKFITANSAWCDNSISVKTLTSTDEGVAFIIDVDDKTIYHAGDLHWWVWQGESDEFNEQMTKSFKHEISKIENQHFDLAFLVLDPRQEDWFYKGFDYFMSHTDTNIVYPMHFWNDNSVIDKIIDMDCSKKYRDKIVHI